MHKNGLLPERDMALLTQLQQDFWQHHQGVNDVASYISRKSTERNKCLTYSLMGYIVGNKLKGKSSWLH